MAIRIIFLVIFGFVTAGTIFWYIPATHGLIANTISLVQSNGLLVLLAAVIVVVAMTSLFTRSVTNSRKRKRELDEYLRVAQQMAPETPQTFKRLVVDAPPTDALDVDEGDSQTLPVSEDTTAEAPTPVSSTGPQTRAAPTIRPRKRKTAPPEFSSISDDIYFQPVTNVLLDKIIGYDIYRKATQKTKNESIFIQHLTSGNESDQAAFEFQMLEEAVRASQHRMWTDTAQTSPISFFVRIGGALLDDKQLWRRAAGMVRKQSTANPSITLSVSSAALTGEPAKIIKERLTKLKRLHDTNVPLALCGFDHDRNLVTEDHLGSFYMSFCHKDELLGCHAGDAEPNRCLTYQQVVDASLKVSVNGIVSEADVVDCLSAGAQSMSGDYLAPPRKLRSEAPDNSKASA